MATQNTVEKTKDSFYQVLVSATGASSSFKKIERLTKCGVPSDTKVLDDITATDDRRQVQVPVDYKENSEVEFEYVLIPDDATHQLLQSSYDGNKELYVQLKFVEAPTESRQFKAIISDLTTDAEDTTKKIRKKGKFLITGEETKELTE
ncbi:hypothetical protein [Moraxella canis]|uniref:Phage tail protein n=1 Tax=Moraxella canis TaxID=90239 RepID=A0A1S9ZKN1_9GAMM|nr:hypothetical protein [Moraxella canis]OOR83913.1 hypothetical protein B0180_05585 [Moraxella canis]